MFGFCFLFYFAFWFTVVVWFDLSCLLLLEVVSCLWGWWISLVCLLVALLLLLCLFVCLGESGFDDLVLVNCLTCWVNCCF